MDGDFRDWKSVIWGSFHGTFHVASESYLPFGMCAGKSSGDYPDYKYCSNSNSNSDIIFIIMLVGPGYQEWLIGLTWIGPIRRTVLKNWAAVQDPFALQTKIPPLCRWIYRVRTASKRGFCLQLPRGGESLHGGGEVVVPLVRFVAIIWLSRASKPPTLDQHPENE